MFQKLTNKNANNNACCFITFNSKKVTGIKIRNLRDTLHIQYTYVFPEVWIILILPLDILFKSNDLYLSYKNIKN